MNLLFSGKPYLKINLLRKPFQHKRRGESARPAHRKSQTQNRKPTVWDQAARWYDSLVGVRGTDFHQEIIMPGVLRLLDLNTPNARVLDLACGQGVFSRFLDKKRIRATGLDSSEELLSFARQRPGKSVNYVTGDAGDGSLLKGQTFDGIACILAVQNMENIEDVFRNVARWLKPGARFVLVVTHPCFRIPRQTHWEWDEVKKMEYRRVDRYAEEISIPILTPPFASSEDYTLTYHRPLQSYFQALSAAGLCVDALEEWVSNKESLPGKRAKAENRARKEFPLFLALRSVLLPKV